MLSTALLRRLVLKQWYMIITFNYHMLFQSDTNHTISVQYLQCFNAPRAPKHPGVHRISSLCVDNPEKRLNFQRPDSLTHATLSWTEGMWYTPSTSHCCPHTLASTTVTGSGPLGGTIIAFASGGSGPRSKLAL